LAIPTATQTLLESPSQPSQLNPFDHKSITSDTVGSMHPDRFPELGDETSAYSFFRFLSIAPTPYDEEEIEFDPDQRNTASTMNSVQRQDLDARINAYHSSRFNSIASTESNRKEREFDHNE